LQVKALVRDPSKLPGHLRSNIEVIQGDVTKAEDVQQTVEGQDAVVVTLGTRNDLGVLNIQCMENVCMLGSYSELFILLSNPWKI
jgi:uncharacterized protein YbjT (DUF2867 family)